VDLWLEAHSAGGIYIQDDLPTSSDAHVVIGVRSLAETAQANRVAISLGALFHIPKGLRQ